MTDHQQTFSDAVQAIDEQYIQACEMLDGKNRPRDVLGAVKILESLSAQDHADAHASLGLVYRHGAYDANNKIEPNTKLADFYTGKAKKLRHYQTDDTVVVADDYEQH